jgi:hypothetical protein
MKKHLFVASMLLLAASACQKPATENPIDNDLLLGYWQMAYYGPNQTLTYARVPGEGDLSDAEKSQMLRFLPPDRFGEFFWNWCGTPPAMPSEWREGSWQRRPGSSNIIDVERDNQSFVLTIEMLDADSLRVRWGF